MLLVENEASYITTTTPEYDWTDSHITISHFSCGIDVPLYVGWDETGADVVHVSSDRNEVVNALYEYAEILRTENEVLAEYNVQ